MVNGKNFELQNLLQIRDMNFQIAMYLVYLDF